MVCSSLADRRHGQQVRGTNESRQTILGVNIDRHHQVETKECQIREVILGQTLTTQVRVHATKTAKAIHCHTNAFEVGKFNAAIITYHHVFNVAPAINKRADLSPCFV
jgi:hypothetical protein